MTASSLGSHWLHLPQCESTNDELIRLGRAGAAHGRSSPPMRRVGDEVDRGALGFHRLATTCTSRSSCVRRCRRIARHRCVWPLAWLFDAVSALLQEAGVGSAIDLRLKWPNDLLAAPRLASAATEYRKLGGILTELFGLSGSIDFVVIGIGCNVRTRDFPAGVPATSLACLPPSAVDSRPLLSPRLVAERFLAALFFTGTSATCRAGHADQRSLFAYARLGPSHPPVEVKLRPDEPSLRGIPIALGPDGELLLQTGAGIERVLSGDVVMAPFGQPPTHRSRAGVSGLL